MVMLQRQANCVVQRNFRGRVLRGARTGTTRHWLWARRGAFLARDHRRRKQNCYNKINYLLQVKTPRASTTEGVPPQLSFIGLGRFCASLNYREGGARGAILRSTTIKISTVTPDSSRRFTAGIIATTGEDVAIAVPVVEQMGQACVFSAPELSSKQQCNCAARNTTPSSTASK